MSNTRYDFGHHQTILAIKLDEHLHDTSNPHKIDKRQVGLGNVDNVSFDEIKNYTNTYAGSYLAVESDEEGKYNISLYNKNNQKLGESIEIDTDNEFTITSVSLDLENKKLIFKRENASDLTCDISSLINYVDSKFDKTGGTITGDVTIYANNDTNEPHGKLTVGGTNHKVTILGNPTDGANVIVGNTYYESSKIEDSLAATGISFADQSWNLVLYSALGDVKANDTIIPKNKTLETTDNKVSSWSPTTTDTHYPSEKLVKAECDNIRAVAEGKCKTYVLSYSTTAPTEETFSSGRYCTSDGTPLDTWEEFISYLSPITPTLLVNRNFNSQSGYISLEFTEEEEEGEVITYNCSYLLVKRVENNSWKYMVLKFLDILQPEVTPFKIGDMFLVTETNVPDRWYAGWNVLYKLETSKVDLGWSQIGTTKDPKPTTLFGYGITDAVNTTGSQWITGQKTFRGSQVLADGRYDNPTYKWTFYVSGSSYPQLGGLHIYTNSQNGSGLWLTNNGQSLVAVKDPADTNSYSSVGGYFLNGNNQSTYQFFNDLFLSDAIYTATKKEGAAGTSRAHYCKLSIPTLTTDTTIATTTDLNNYLPLSGGTVTGNLTAPNLTATNSIKIGNTTLDEDDLKRLLGSLVVNGTSNGDLY